MFFANRSKRSFSVFTPSPTGRAPVYEEVIGLKGDRYLKKTGEHNLNDFVQASKAGTLVYNILDRFQRGDVSVLQKTAGFYADVTAMPKTLFETHQFLDSLSQKFESLDPKIKDKFDGSFDKFVKGLENGELTKILNEMASGVEKLDPPDHAPDVFPNNPIDMKEVK